MRDAGGARLRAPKRFLAPRQPQPFKVKLADQRDAPSPSQAEGAMPSGAILTKAGAILPQPDCNSRRGIAPDCTKLHQIAPNCGHCAKKSKRRKPDPDEKYPSPIFLLPSYCLQSGRGVPPPGFESTTAGRRGHLSRLSYASPSQAVRDIESGWIQPAPIQVNPG